jgi:hypothetical protein
LALIALIRSRTLRKAAAANSFARDLGNQHLS